MSLLSHDVPETADDLVALAQSQGVRFIFAQFVDMHGKPNAKLVPVHELDSLMSAGAGFAGFAAGAMGQNPNDPDLAAIPDPVSYTQLPWQPEVARIACDIYVNGEPWPYCPRTILRNQLTKAAALGYEFKIGIELEYFLLRRDENGRIQIADPLDTAESPCYDMRGLTRSLDFVTEVADYLDTLGWGNYATDHEDGLGQFEQNFGFADALTTADLAIFFRYMVETLAQKRGMIATFMPKPFAHLTGNGGHYHMSLWRNGENLFDEDPANDPNGLGLSPLAYNFIGGLKKHASAYIAVTAPIVNSYKRLVVGTQSGSSWAPIYISYGSNNRTQMLRIPDAGRIEDRTVDGACNPYLGAAAVLTAGLDGIENELSAGAPTGEMNLHAAGQDELDRLGVKTLPGNLLDAVRELERNDVMRAGLGRCQNEDYVDYFARVKRTEWERAHSEITEWELDRYLQLF